MKRKAIALLCLLVASVGTIGSALAISYQTEVEVDFTINPTLEIEITGRGSTADLLIEDLAPGSSANSNTITVTLNTNAAYGYRLSATVDSDNFYKDGDTTSSDYFTSIDSETTLAGFDGLSGSKWGYSTLGTTYGPLYTDTETTLLENQNMPTGGSVSTPFLIRAKAASDQSLGEYTNVVNFIAVASTLWDGIIDCPGGYICYSPNVTDNREVAGSMNDNTYSGDTTSKIGYQSVASNATSKDLIASDSDVEIKLDDKYYNVGKVKKSQIMTSKTPVRRCEDVDQQALSYAEIKTL